MSNLKMRKYINFIYYKNFEDYERKYNYISDYYINTNHAKYYLKMGYNIRFEEINDSIIYEKESKMYDDDEIMEILFNMK